MNPYPHSILPSNLSPALYPSDLGADSANEALWPLSRTLIAEIAGEAEPDASSSALAAESSDELTVDLGLRRAEGALCSQLLEELRRRTDHLLSPAQRRALLAAAGLVPERFQDRALGHAALDFAREYAALHVRTLSGLTPVEVLAEERRQDPDIARLLAALSQSAWDLYRVVRQLPHTTELVRLHDGHPFSLHESEWAQPLMPGHTLGLRLVALGSMTWAPWAITLDQGRMVRLHEELELRFGASGLGPDGWARFMRRFGSLMVLRHAVEDLYGFDDLEDASQEAVFEPLRLDCDAGRLVELERAFAALEAALEATPDGVFGTEGGELNMVTDAGRIFRLEGPAHALTLLVFASREILDAYLACCQGTGSVAELERVAFLRLWRLPQELLTAEDRELLEEAFGGPVPQRAALPGCRRAGFVADDVTEEDLDTLLHACEAGVRYLERMMRGAA